jgi:hypothetical protein
LFSNDFLGNRHPHPPSNPPRRLRLALAVQDVSIGFIRFQCHLCQQPTLLSR